MSQKRSFHTLLQFRVTPLTPSQGDVTEMPDTTVLRAARTSSVNNLKTIPEVGNNLTYPGSFVSPSNTYDQRLKKVSFELPKNSKESLDTRSVQAKGSVATYSSDLDRLFLSQSFTCPLRHVCMNALPFPNKLERIKSAFSNGHLHVAA